MSTTTSSQTLTIETRTYPTGDAYAVIGGGKELAIKSTREGAERKLAEIAAKRSSTGPKASEAQVAYASSLIARFDSQESVDFPSVARLRQMSASAVSALITDLSA